MHCNIFHIYSFVLKQLISTFYLAITSYVKSQFIQTLLSHYCILWNIQECDDFIAALYETFITRNINIYDYNSVLDIFFKISLLVLS
jgi:hypothetical protein